MTCGSRVTWSVRLTAPASRRGAVYSDTVKVKTNILLSDIRTPDDASRVVAVELPEGTIRDKLNLVDNEAIYRKKIVVRGNIRQYLGQTGLVDVTQYVKK